MNDAYSIQTLTESFVALADEVQSLIDRKTILEHKLRYAHEQYQYLADKYAVPDVSETLAKLQIPPDIHSLATATSAVPLPRRSQTGNNQHQIALLIREGRRAAQQLAAGMGGAAQAADTSRDMSLSHGMEILTTASTVLEKDFTVQGRKSSLACPFSAKPNQNGVLSPSDGEGVASSQGIAHDVAAAAAAAATVAAAADTTPHKSSDPICAAMLEDRSSLPEAAAAAAAGSQCPIRFLDKHSPEEIAHYVETHKHEIPRSHEVCVRRYQRNEEQIRKLDAKYGNLVSMVEDLSHLHRPMLPPADANRSGAEVDTSTSNKRVEDWAQTVVAGEPETEDVTEPQQIAVEDDDDEQREGRFDRPFREVRLGESPSRPWGIPVPLPAGVRSDEVPAVRESSSPVPPLNPQLAAGMTTHIDPTVGTRTESKKCPFDHAKLSRFQGMLRPKESSPPPAFAGAVPRADTPFERPSSTLKDDAMPSSPPQPTFINIPELNKTAEHNKGERPQVVINISGPVFIGYPMEQAMQFMQQYQPQQQGR
ncbi:hypothetical protein QBC35DRAFT_502034 [Podospora australis]|uniref:Uncharacterized protein n=1 Tax=Podospora australis TaxID=1536484 RepID=A0AAN6WQA9_9PEZI|nr:hypothetical protein QBC35DRAFT_502034 [Podospora australis]